MFGRGFLFLATIVGTAVVPYLLSNSSGVTGLLVGTVPNAEQNEAAESAAAQGAEESASQPHEVHKAKPLGPHDTPMWPMEQVFTFDVSTAWVLSHWPRVSASLAELDLQGYRVPLLTGTSESDVAGSLTYYFNREQQVEKITFHGAAGDTRRFVGLMEQRFGFRRELTDDPSLFLYQVKKWGKPTSELRITPSEVVRASDPHSRFAISLNLVRP